jgi:glucose-fructose oxidoreductase
VVSGDAQKRRTLAGRYGVPAYDYADFEACISEQSIDAVYIGLPNDQHCEFTERAARAGVHVLCEKPMAVTPEECRRMIRATERAGVKLMIAYRLHFEPANMAAIEIARSGKLGDLRIFDSTFTMQVRAGNIRLDAEKGGGPLHDIGIYCIQAARHVLRSEPLQVFATSASGKDARFREVDETVSAVLRFPEERIATFTCSFGAADVSSYRMVGSKGDLRVEPAYEYVEPLVHHLTIDGKKRTRKFARHDQFAPELVYFARCIQTDASVEPSGKEGLIDIEIIDALLRSAKAGSPIDLPAFRQDRRPSIRQVRKFPAVRKPSLVRAKSAST